MLSQRLGSRTQLDPQFISEFIRIVTAHPGSCDEVWLATSYGFPPLSVHREMAEKLATVAEQLRAVGIRVSLQISNTIGHGQYMSSCDCSGLVYDGSPAENIIGPDGTVSDYCFCWNGAHVRNYIREEVRAYCEKIKPHTVWIDDDLRVNNHLPVQIGCFCPHCIARFNERFGTHYTREELNSEINRGDIRVRENWVAHQRDGISDFTYDIYHAIHEVSPTTFAGLQNGANGGYMGFGLSHVFDAMYRATEKPPKYRPGGGAYSDHNPNDMIWKMYSLAWQNSMLPDYVDDIRPEIESLPDVRFGKTIAGTCYETTLYLASGANAMSYAIMMNDYEDMNWHGEMLAAFASHRAYWKRLSEVSSHTHGGGLQMTLGHEMWKRTLTAGETDFAWAGEPYFAVSSRLTGIGLPLTFDAPKNPVCPVGPVGILNAQMAELMTDAELEELLSRPVFCDGGTLAVLEARGFGAAFSAHAEPCATGQYYTEYTDHPVNRGFVGRKWSQSFYFKEGHRLIDTNGKTEPLSLYGSASLNAPVRFPDTDAPYGVADAIVLTVKGAKWAVFGHTPWNATVSTERRTQLLRAIDAIAPNRLPAVLETPVQALVLPRENENGETVAVSILNNTVGASGMLTLRIRRPIPHGTTVTFCTQYAPEIRLPYTEDEGGITVTVPSLAPWTLGTVFLGD